MIYSLHEFWRLDDPAGNSYSAWTMATNKTNIRVGLLLEPGIGFFMKPLMQTLMLALVFSMPASAQEDPAGLKYWNGIDKEAITTSSGLQYKVLVEGKGRKPGAKDRVDVHYRGLLLDGTQFDSSYSEDEPVTLRLSRVIKGWTEGIQLMPVGSVFVFLIPPELAYGEKGTGPIPPDATLIFEVELFKIK